MAKQPSNKPIVLDTFKGLALDTDPERRGLGTASDCANVTISDVGGVVRGEYGATLYEADEPAAYAVDGLADWRSKTDGTHKVLSLVNGKLYASAGAGWSEVKDVSNASLGATAGKFMQSAMLDGKLFCVNGSEHPWYFDGTNWALWGQEGPTTLSTVTPSRPYVGAGSGSSTLTTPGVHEVFITFYNETTFVESPPSQITSYQVPASSAKKVKVFTGYAQTAGTYKACPSWATHIRAWMTLADTPCTFYLAHSIGVPASGGTAEFTFEIDDQTDLSLSGNTAWMDFYGPPDKPFGIFKFGPEYTRIGIYGSPSYPSRLWWTNALEPLVFSDANWMEFGSDDGDRIQAAAQVSGGVLVLKRNSTWFMGGSGPLTYHTLPVSSTIGCEARYSLVVSNGVGYWISRNGVFACNGGMPKNISDGKCMAWTQGINWTYPDYVRGCFVPERNQIWWTAAYGAATAPDKTLILDLYTGEFLLNDHAIRAMTVEVVSGMERTVCGLATGDVLVLDDRAASPGYNWNAAAQAKSWTSNWIPTGGQLDEVEIFHEKQTAGTLTVTITGVNTADDDDAFTRTIQVDMTDYHVRRFPCPMSKEFVKVALSNSTVSQTMGVRRVVLYATGTGRMGMDV